mmetsp:Transcript_41701/g.88868  ORF Transcript_41701/g.88868 Transcript_41701/m.88868 type:complete len:224 (-) Transcript_41701:1121-1792(-)
MIIIFCHFYMIGIVRFACHFHFLGPFVIAALAVAVAAFARIIVVASDIAAPVGGSSASGRVRAGRRIGALPLPPLLVESRAGVDSRRLLRRFERPEADALAVHSAADGHAKGAGLALLDAPESGAAAPAANQGLIGDASQVQPAVHSLHRLAGGIPRFVLPRRLGIDGGLLLQLSFLCHQLSFQLSLSVGDADAFRVQDLLLGHSFFTQRGKLEAARPQRLLQ